MKDQESHIANGSIDATGKATASLHLMDLARGTDCTLVAVWQKQR